MKRSRVALFGATGSIGTNTLRVISKYRDKFELVAFSVHESLEGYYRIIREFKPKLAVITGNLKVSSPPVTTLYGKEGLIEVSEREDVDIIVVATSGNIGVYPTTHGLKSGKRVALANKETLVSFGKIVKETWLNSSGELIPIDSEHSALFQLFEKYRGDANELILTASGGPFRTFTREEMNRVTIDDVLKHPVWKMGKKITVDSATLMNKGLEVIEAYWLFDFPPEKIKVLIHPQSIVHGMLKLRDGAFVAHLSYPDMKIPIQYALTYPERWECDFVQLDLTEVGRLEFYKPDFDRFPLLKLAYEMLKAGGVMPCVMNAANDIAVDAFLKGYISFLDIERIVTETCSSFENVKNITLETLESYDRKAREKAKEILNSLKK
uniref:1-deoxy-D-xylulose 5-phosphate reductoisomerase n=1 Tax=candidate division WOR-3 bacterium TaxID=2052148 RepID=A0A7V3ZWD4_UNCW3